MFKKFTNFRKSKKPRISITPYGNINFNCGTIREFKIENKNFVSLYFDEETRRAGFIFHDDEVKDSQKVSTHKSSKSISACNFIETFKLSKGKTVSYSAFKSGDEMIVIDLKEYESELNGIN